MPPKRRVTAPKELIEAAQDMFLGLVGEDAEGHPDLHRTYLAVKEAYPRLKHLLPPTAWAHEAFGDAPQ